MNTNKYFAWPDLKSIRFFFQYTIGILFLASGVLKVIDTKTFAVLINTYDIWKGLGYLAPLISASEIVLGLLLLFNIEPKKTIQVVLWLTVIFTLAFTYAFYTKGIDDCGCMGSLISLPPSVTFARNAYIIAGSLRVINSLPLQNSEGEIKPWKKWLIASTVCFSFAVAGFSLAHPIFNKNKIHSGDNLKAGMFRFLDQSMFDGQTAIFIFSPTCGHCWNATENIKSIKRLPEFSNLIGVTYRDVDLTEYTQEMEPNFEIIHYPTADLQETIKEVPVLLILENGKVKRIFSSEEIPCGKMLQEAMHKD